MLSCPTYAGTNLSGLLLPLGLVSFMDKDAHLRLKKNRNILQQNVSDFGLGMHNWSSYGQVQCPTYCLHAPATCL